MLVVGVTGGIGSGKSTVAARLAERGARLVDADRIARAVLRKGGLAREAVLARFGPGILGGDGEIDRAKLAGVAFRDPGAREDLNALTHPRIREQILAELDSARREGAAFAVLEAALLVEAGATDLVQLLVVVTAPREKRLERLLARGGFPRADIEARMAGQADDSRLVDAAHIVVSNDGDLAALAAKTDRLWEEIRQRANPGAKGERP